MKQRECGNPIVLINGDEKHEKKKKVNTAKDNAVVRGDPVSSPYFFRWAGIGV